MKKLEAIENQAFYTQIKNLIEQLRPQQILTRFRGNCVAATDLIQNLLHQHGIESRIIEVQLTSTKFYSDGNTEFLFVGYDNLNYPGQIDTHLVVITNTTIPLLIDCSIGHLLDGTELDYILLPTNSTDQFFADYKINDIQITYQIKKNIRLPALHQRTLVERMAEESKIKDSIYWLKWMAVVGIGMSIFNMFANILLIILKMMNP
jgi:hypothetical protein